MIAVLFLSIPPTLGKILVLKIKENQSRILIGETKNRRPIISWFFSPGIRRNYSGFAFNSDGGPK